MNSAPDEKAFDYSTKEIVSRHKSNAGQIPAADTPAASVIPHQTKAQKQAERDEPKSVQPKSEKISHLSFDPSALHILSNPLSARRDALQRDFEGERISQKVTKEIASQHKGDVDQRAEHIIIDIPAITISDESPRAAIRQQGVESLIFRLLYRRCGEIPLELKTQIQALSLPQLEDLGEALLDFSSSNDLVYWLQSIQ